MKGDSKKHGMCRVNVAVIVTVIDILSDSTMVMRETTRKCGLKSLILIPSTPDLIVPL